MPLFVAARRPSGRTCHVLLKDIGESDPEGPFYCHVSAPNGREAEGEVDQLDYRAVRKLFDVRNDLNLAIDGGISSGGGRKLESADLRLWSAGAPIDPPPGQFELIHGPRGTSRIRIAETEGSRIDHVQMWSEPGAVTVTVWPAGGSLIPLPGLPNVQRRVRPVVLGRDLRCSAYWGFYRHSNLPAVRELGNSMLVLASDGQYILGDDELAVAAHFALNFVNPASDLLTHLAARLEDRTSSDAAILLWAIAFDGRLHYSNEQRLRAFERAILSLAGTGCLYTEVFRMLVQRLGEGEELWREHLPPDAPPPVEIDRAIQWAKQLATATYWDAEHLTYRALDPRYPDANATDDQLGIGAKKKSAVVPLG